MLLMYPPTEETKHDGDSNAADGPFDRERAVRQVRELLGLDLGVMFHRRDQIRQLIGRQPAGGVIGDGAASGDEADRSAGAELRAFDRDRGGPPVSPAAFSLQLAVSARPPVTRPPDPASGTCFGLANSPWLRPFPPATPQALSLPCSPLSSVLRPHPTSSFRAPSDTESSFPLRPRFDCRGRMKTSQVPTKDVRTCMGSPTPWSPPSPHQSR